jgi:hypothetical protein
MNMHSVLSILKRDLPDFVWQMSPSDENKIYGSFMFYYPCECRGRLIMACRNHDKELPAVEHGEKWFKTEPWNCNPNLKTTKWLGARVKILGGRHAHSGKTGIVVSIDDVPKDRRSCYFENDIIVKFDPECVMIEEFCFFFEHELERI